MCKYNDSNNWVLFGNYQLNVNYCTVVYMTDILQIEFMFLTVVLLLEGSWVGIFRSVSILA